MPSVPSARQSGSSRRPSVHAEGAALRQIRHAGSMRPRLQDPAALVMKYLNSESDPTLLALQELQEGNNRSRTMKNVARQLPSFIGGCPSVPSHVAATASNSNPTFMSRISRVVPSTLALSTPLEYLSEPSQPPPHQRTTPAPTPGRRAAVDYGDLSADSVWRSLICTMQCQEPKISQPQEQYQTGQTGSALPNTP